MEETETGQSIHKENWYCFQALPKKECLAYEHISSRVGIPAFAPRVRYKKLTKRGKRLFTEALFPGYVFAFMSLENDMRHVLSMPGIRKIVSFGDRIPVIPATLMDELVEKFDQHSFYEMPDAPLQMGDRVVITEGSLLNVEALVSGILPARDRVRLLLEFLGRELTVDLPLSSVMVKENGLTTDFSRENRL